MEEKERRMPTEDTTVEGEADSSEADSEAEAEVDSEEAWEEATLRSHEGVEA